MQKNHLLKLLVSILGLFIIALGVALSVKANLGVSPISCIPYILYRFKIPLTLGTLTIIFNTLLILMQMMILRKNYKPIQLVQLPVIFIFGLFIDLALYLVSGISMSNYTWQAFWCLASCAVIGFGVFLEVKANIFYLPGEGLAMAIADTFKKEFGKTKIGVDTSMVFLGVISSFILLHELEGVREGTIAAAILVGYLVRYYSKKLPVIEKWMKAGAPKNTL